ncbi:MAG: 3-deoxy-manno-octulosonate cytidylyltransferase, partial [Pontiella sp.]|nr:3-deoxy-manno-octulosonate cytidylyltransferase [Pontiella sp.]
MKIAGVIPSRWGSTRFPGKSLAILSGKPMIQWVVERVRQAKKLDAVMVATDDSRIADCVEALGLPGVQVAMTRSDHPTGTDRIAEAIETLDVDAVINVQGDEPLIPPAVIDQVAALLAADAAAGMATLMTPLAAEAEFTDPNMAKVVASRDGAAIYFSRAPIPA